MRGRNNSFQLVDRWTTEQDIVGCIGIDQQVSYVDSFTEIVITEVSE